jgi:hypothetical protein
MESATYIAAKQTLESQKSGVGLVFNNREVHIRDTVGIACGVAVVDMDFFGTGEKGVMWKSKGFPSNNLAYEFTHVTVDVDAMFATTALANTRLLKYFLKNSYLEIRNNGVDILRAPLASLVTYEIIPNIESNPDADATVEYFKTIARKINNAYKFREPFVCNAGMTPDVKIIVATGLTTAAYSATYNPVVTGLTLSDGTAQGNFVQIEFQGASASING